MRARDGRFGQVVRKVTVHGLHENFAENQGVRHIFGGFVFSQEQRISAEE